MPMLIGIIEGQELKNLLVALGANPQDASVRSLRVHQQPDGAVMLKINSGTWTTPLGSIDPQSDYAAHLREVESGRIRVLTDPEV